MANDRELEKQRQVEEAAKREKAAREEDRRRNQQRDVGKGDGGDRPGPYGD